MSLDMPCLIMTRVGGGGEVKATKREGWGGAMQNMFHLLKLLI